MSAEVWKAVVDWEGIYEVSDLGSVRRVRRGRGTTGGLMRGSVDRNGYPEVDLSDRGRRWLARRHRLVAEAFLGPIPSGMETRHLNGDAGDPRLVNLAYGTHTENMQDMVEHGHSRRFRITHCPSGHEYDEANTYYDHRDARNCRKCLARRQRERMAKLRAEADARGELYFRNVRRWGRSNGFVVRETGRISNELLNAYDVALKAVAA